MATMDRTVSVVIPAHNAEGTIARAVGTALREPEVGEVIVVDDASSDRTVSAARSADDGTGRARFERIERNNGPSAARNHGFALARLPNLALLDADDCFLPGRFGALLAQTGWDLIADNIVFVGDGDPLPLVSPRLGTRTWPVVLSDFVLSNV